jgi:hypothetical protein
MSSRSARQSFSASGSMTGSSGSRRPASPLTPLALSKTNPNAPSPFQDEPNSAFSVFPRRSQVHLSLSPKTNPDPAFDGRASARSAILRRLYPSFLFTARTLRQTHNLGEMLPRTLRFGSGSVGSGLRRLLEKPLDPGPERRPVESRRSRRQGVSRTRRWRSSPRIFEFASPAHR